MSEEERTPFDVFVKNFLKLYSKKKSINSMNKSPLQIGIAGFGTVGSGLVKCLAENKELIFKRIGREINIKTVLVRDLNKVRATKLPENTKLITNMDELTHDPALDIIVELIGGTDTAYKLIDTALKYNKHVVTANKALLAENGLGLFQKAAEKGCALLYEASVAGGIPIIQTLKESLAGNRIDSILGILNGTSNYILSEMTNAGLDFDTALAQAQAKGYAESDPTLDIDGHDAAHKLVLLIRLAYNMDYPYKDMPTQGIRNISTLDINFAKKFGYRIKLLAHAQLINNKLEAGVYPTLVPNSYLIANVEGAYNAVRIDGNAVGSLFLHGKGAGDLPTASAVLGDIMSIARGMPRVGLNIGGQNADMFELLSPDLAENLYYIRAMVHDSPGVLRDIAGALSKENISIAQVIQKQEDKSGVPLIIMTHNAQAKAIKKALDAVEKSGLLRDPAVYYRVLG